MSDERRARFETLPGNIILNSLYVPGRGGTHYIMGQANSKQEALQAVHHHLKHFGFKFDKVSPKTLPWKDIEPRKEEKGHYQTGYSGNFPIRTQAGVVARVNPRISTSIYADDYATGKIPWTIRVGQNYGGSNIEEFDRQHEGIKHWFKNEGNQKISFFSFFKRAGYNFPNKGLSSEDQDFLSGQMNKNKSRSTGGDWRTQLPNLHREWSEIEPILANKVRAQGQDVGLVYAKAARTLKLCIDAKQDSHPNYESVTGKKRNV